MSYSEFSYILRLQPEEVNFQMMIKFSDIEFAFDFVLFDSYGEHEAYCVQKQENSTIALT